NQRRDRVVSPAGRDVRGVRQCEPGEESCRGGGVPGDRGVPGGDGAVEVVRAVEQRRQCHGGGGDSGIGGAGVVWLRPAARCQCAVGQVGVEPFAAHHQLQREIIVSCGGGVEVGTKREDQGDGAEVISCGVTG